MISRIMQTPEQRRAYSKIYYANNKEKINDKNKKLYHKGHKKLKGDIIDRLVQQYKRRMEEMIMEDQE